VATICFWNRSVLGLIGSGALMPILVMDTNRRWDGPEGDFV
jgi:hypothetical protein